MPNLPTDLKPGLPRSLFWSSVLLVIPATILMWHGSADTNYLLGVAILLTSHALVVLHLNLAARFWKGVLVETLRMQIGRAVYLHLEKSQLPSTRLQEAIDEVTE